jgi:hypothetical protein
MLSGSRGDVKLRFTCFLMLRIYPYIPHRLASRSGRSYHGPMAAHLAIAAAATLVGLAALRGRRGGRSSISWSVADTDLLLQATEALREPARSWIFVAAKQNKERLLDAYEALPEAQKEALARATALTWLEEGAPSPRPLFRKPSKHEERAGLSAGGLSLSRRPDVGRYASEPDLKTRVFLVEPSEVAVDSLVPNIREGWHKRFNEWDPPGYDWSTGRPTHRRGQMTHEELRRFGRSPLFSDQYDAEEEVILRRGASPLELSWAEYLDRFSGGPR